MRAGITRLARPRFARGPRALALAGAAIALAVAACSSGPPGGSSGGGTGSYLRYAPCCSWGTTWSFNNYNPVAFTAGQGLIQLPLAVEDDPSLTNFTPQLASSWTASGNTLTINLRTDAKWQDGTPVTSTDVYDTIVLNGTGSTTSQGTGGWLYIAGLSTPSKHQVVITTQPGTNVTLLEDELLPLTVLPAETYGQFVSPGLAQDDAAFYEAQAKDPATAQKSPPFAAIEAVFKKLSSYNVPKLIGDGPFTLKAINTAQALLVKSPTFYGAANIHVPGILFYDDQNQAIYPLMLGGQADFSNVYMSPAILKQWAGVAGSNTATPEGFTFAMLFNDHSYPLNLTPVRQALAYLIPRGNMVASAYGGASVKDRGGVVNTYSDGLPQYETPLYLTPSQIASLNPYPVDDAKAAALLKSAGFHQSGGTWIMPNGKPFTLSFLVNSATSDIVSSFEEAATALTAFGIKSSVDATQGTIQNQDVHNGDFQVSMNLEGGPNPLYNNLDQLLGSIINYETVGDYAGDHGVGYGPTAAVPGLGTVNIATALDQESETVGPGPQLNSLVYDWAKLVNDQVPFITYATKGYQFSFSSQRFTDWPPMDATGTSALWNIMGQGNSSQALTLMLENGYIRPKS